MKNIPHSSHISSNSAHLEKRHTTPSLTPITISTVKPTPSGNSLTTIVVSPVKPHDHSIPGVFPLHHSLQDHSVRIVDSPDPLISPLAPTKSFTELLASAQSQSMDLKSLHSKSTFNPFHHFPENNKKSQNNNHRITITA